MKTAAAIGMFAMLMAAPALAQSAKSKGGDLAPAVYAFPDSQPAYAPGTAYPVPPQGGASSGVPAISYGDTVPGGTADIAVGPEKPLAFDYAAFCKQPARDGRARTPGWLSACMEGQQAQGEAPKN